METATDWSELQVPGEPGVWWCARHKNTQTRLRCGRCEKPICPKCVVMAPTGARCRDCVSNRTAHMYQVGPRHLAMAFGASLVVGALGVGATELVGAFWFWILLYAPAIGPILGRIITQITGGKRGPKVATIVTLGLIVGAFAASTIGEWISLNAPPDPEFGVHHIQHFSTALLFTLVLFNGPMWIFLALAIGGVWWWLK